jgi:hypothetical protein
MEKAAHDGLLAEIATQSVAGSEIAVPLELFFRGNDDPGSIGCNLGEGGPTVARFYQILKNLLGRSDIQDVWVRIADASDKNSWPYSDTVYVIAALSQREMEELLEPLQFSEVTAGWMYDKPSSVPEPKVGFTPYSIWWD